MSGRTVEDEGKNKGDRKFLNFSSIIGSNQRSKCQSLFNLNQTNFLLPTHFPFLEGKL